MPEQNEQDQNKVYFRGLRRLFKFIFAGRNDRVSEEVDKLGLHHDEPVAEKTKSVRGKTKT